MPLRLKSLSTQLTIVFTTLVVGLVALLSFFAFQMASRSLEDAVRRDLFNMVDQATSALDKEIQERVREVQTISLAPTIRNGAIDMSETHVTIPVSQRNEDALRSRFGGDTCLDELPEVTRHLQTVLASHSYIAALILTDRFGISVSCTGESRRIENSSETWWQEAMRRGISLSNLTPNPTTGAYQYAVSIAIPDGKRSPAGVLRAVFNLNQMQSSLNAMRIGERGFVMAMVRTGTIFSHPNSEYLWQKVQDVPELSQLTRVVASRAPRGTLIYEPHSETTAQGSSPGTARGARTASVPGSSHPASLASAPEDSWILAYGRMFRPASLGPLGWTVVATVSRAEVIAPIYAIRYRVAAFGGTVVFFAVLLVWYLSRRLARPLIDLARRADLIAAGDLGVYLSIPQKNEIGRLASALASMVDSLSAANRTLTRTNLNLEIIVADRTSELRDKTELLEEQSKQVLEASRLKSQFLANMSHELRTPLNAILALSDILAQRLSGDLNEEQVKQVTIINRSGGNLLRLINDILDLSKIEAGRMEVHEDVFDLKTTLATLRDTIEPLAADKGLAFTIVPDPALPPSMKSDDPKIRQVLLNLLGNAVKFTERGGVTLTLSRRYRKLPGTDEEPPPLTDEGPFWLELEVKDTGVGISPQALQHIFEEFQQADGSTTRKYGGSGLGLAISKKLVELLGGELSAESVMGRGSTFRALIPVEGVASAESTIEARRPAGAGRAVSATPGSATSLPSDSRAQPAGTRGLVNPDESLGGGTPGRPWVTPLKEHPVPISPRFLDIRDDANSLLPHRPTLLVVDDDPESLYVYRQFLSRQGYQVIFAISGEQVLDKARQYKPVAIILDLMLPQKSGWEVLEELKFAEDLREIPVIIASALDHRDRGLCAGAFRFLTKPMSERQLSSVLQELERARKKDVHRVLVIDDDPVELGIARTLFEKAGLDVTTKDSGEEAVIWARNECPDIIVLDLLMPAMDGFEVLSRLKSDAATAGIPVLIYTAKDVTEEDRRRLLPSVRRIFPKVPLQIEEMLEELEKALQTVPHAIRPVATPGPELARPPQDAPEDPAGTASVDSPSLQPQADRTRAESGVEPSADRIPATGTAAAPSGETASGAARDEFARTGNPVQAGAITGGTLDEPASGESELVETGPLPLRDAHEGDSRPLPRIRILLVEDDTANQYTIGFLLRSAGYEVIIAENGEEGLQAAERFRPHMILMDMMMPVMSGFEATRILKSRPDLKGIPVIALTAAAMAGDRERTLAAGCDDYVSKPVDRILLLERVRHWKAVCRGEEPADNNLFPAAGGDPGSSEGARERADLQVAVGTSVGARREDRGD